MATITGTSGSNTISGGSGADTILGLAGNDSLSGGGGDDILRGGTGNDTIDGGSGTDLIDVSDATGGINFTLVQSSSSTSVNLASVGLGTDSYKNIEGVIATNFDDTLTGSTLNDVLSGGGGNDILRGRAGNDTIDGGSGTDRIDFSDATGGINFTLVQSSSSTSVNVSGVGLGTDTYKNIEGVIGTNFNDTLTGSSYADTIYGGGGSDTIVGGLGGDLLTGGSGRDSFVFRSTNNNTVTDSPYASGGPILAPFTSLHSWDIITDFTHNEDKLDLSQLDTRLTGAGPSTLAWLGERGADVDAGTLNSSRVHGVWTNTDHTFIYADIDGDGRADMKIQVSNVDSSDVIGVNHAPEITVGACDRAAASLTETNTGRSTSGELTVVDVDRTDVVSASVQSVALSGVTGGLTPANVLSMLTVCPPSVAADPGAAGNLHWEFDSGTQAFNFLAAGEQLTLTYTLKADDGHAGSDTQAVTITINGTNDAPNISVGGGGRATASLTETNEGLSTNGKLTVVDADLTDVVSASVRSVVLSGVTGGLAPADVLSMLTVLPSEIAANPDQTNNLDWAFDSHGQAFDFLGAGEQLTLTYTLKADDGHGGSDTQVVAITVTGTNDAPDITVGAGDSAAAALSETNEGLSTSGKLTVVDADLSDEVSPSVQSVALSGVTGGLSSEDVLSMLTVPPSSIAANPDQTNNLDWAFDSHGQAFDFLAAGEQLTLSYTLKADDGRGGSDTQTVAITINGANDAPLGFDDSASATEKGGTDNASGGNDASGNVITNDTDVDSAGLTVSAIRAGASEDAGTAGTLGAGLAGAHGTLTLAADGSYTYVIDENDAEVQALNSGDTLSDSFNYTVQDGGGLTDTAVLTISIHGANDAPDITVGEGDHAAAALSETNEGLSTSGKLTVVDADLSDEVSPSVESVALSGVTGGLSSEDVLSMLTVPPSSIAANPDQTNNLDWAFDSHGQAFDFLAAGEQLTLSYTLKADDGHGGSDTQTVDITITGTNDAPDITVGAGDSAAAALSETNEGLSTSGKLTVVDADLSDEVSPSVQSVALSGVTGGLSSEDVLSMLTVPPSSIAANPDQTNNLDWAFDSHGQAFDFLAAGEQLTLSYTLKADDGRGGSDTQTVAITINGANDAPLGFDDSASATEKGGTDNASGGNDASGNVITNDTDVDSAGLTVSAIRAGASEDAGTAGTLGAGLAGAHGTLTLAADGSYTYVIDENDAAVQALNSGDTLSDSFNYTVQDGGGLTDTAVLTISISGANDAPIVTSGATASTPENVSTTTPVYTATATDSDSPTLTYSFGGGVDDSKFSIDGSTGAVTFKVAPNFESPTDSGADNIYDIIVKASDGTLLDTKAVAITVTNVNEAPTAVADIVLTTAGSGATFSIPEAALLANDTDPDSLSLDVAVGSVGSATSGTVAHVAGTGSNGSIRFTDDTAAAGSFQYAATDGSLPGASATVSITNAFTGTGTRAITGTASDEILIGFAGRDSLNGAGGNDIIVGTGGGDTLIGGAGSDSIVYNEGPGSANPVTIHGDAAAAAAGTNSDTLVLTDAATINLSASNQTSASFTTVTGFENVDASRSDAAVILRGSNGVNTLIGGSGADGIFGGNGADNLTGGAGADTFVYASVSNSNQAGFDTITDFTSGSDKIQLNVVTAITTAQGALATATSSVAAHSVAWFFDVANNQTIAYGNPTDGALSGGNAGLGEVHLANTLTLTGGDFVFGGAPAGIAGEPIVLALANPSSDANVQIAVSVSGVPSGWSLNAGTSNGDGTWTVQTNDPSALTVTTDAGFIGATVLTVTETWTNGDGSPGRATVLDNVEAYAPGSPIFAVSTDDNLTGSTGEDLFVFARPIGNNTIYSFDAAADKIDLIGFAGFTSFADLAIANDANGNASIALGASSQITVLGIDAASLTAGNFEFDVEPVITNIGTMAISDGATLPLGGTIENTGMIALDSSGNDTYLQILYRGATLTGGGQLVMSDSDQNVIVGGSGDTALVNHDNIITGAGQLGAGQLTLINEGRIIADGSHALVIDTGSNIVTNSGTMEATGSSGLVVESALANTGSLWAHGGNIMLHGDVTGAGSATISGAATLEFGAASDANVAFDDSAAGTLKLDVSTQFTGTVSGFAAGDSIDLGDVVYADGMQLSYTANDAGTGGTLIVSDGTHSAYITLMGQYQATGMQADGQGGTLLAFDAPAVDHNMTGGAGNDALSGGDKNDTLTGGAGADMLAGGLGDDLFDYNAVSDSGVGAGNRDVIADFQVHADAMANSDAIDLSVIDAITGGGDDAFAFFANADPTVNPGVVANSITWYHSGGNTIVQIDNTGDATAESEIELAGLHTLTSTDFIL